MFSESGDTFAKGTYVLFESLGTTSTKKFDDDNQNNITKVPQSLQKKFYSSGNTCDKSIYTLFESLGTISTSRCFVFRNNCVCLTDVIVYDCKLQKS